ncbi:alpha/beta fold hydrolase [Shimia sediminis]|uniref:alpha/beta fold hydrolase n=1 Tax=Shimia sediminis TaxID=2497945 RepID=UPI000F8D5E48|nr:alpha/beta hydrolase [Shimia sediminis]
MQIEINGHTIHYESHGAGRPVLMLHGGYLDNRHMMDEMEPCFHGRSGWQRIYPDLPGHGRTGMMPGVTSLDSMLEVTLRFMEAVAPNVPFAVSGMSAGGHLARGMVAQCPKRLLGVMMNAPATVVDFDKRRRPDPVTFYEEPEFRDLAGPGTEFLSQAEPVRKAGLADWGRTCMAPALALLDRAANDVLWEPDNYAFSFPLDTAPFEKPSLILTGRQDTVVGFEDAWPVFLHYPRASFAVLDRCGHFIAPENRALFAGFVRDWLDRMEAEL